MDKAGDAAGSRRVRRRFEVTGLVQGVGFRPHVYVAATQLSLTGTVGNTVAGVVVEVEGSPEDVATFGERLRAAPPLARIDSVRELRQHPRGGTGFRIEGSATAGEARTLVSPDVSLCDDCLRELLDPSDRRYRYPFITCTNCGPRFTIVTGVPYDRVRTTMAGFPLCAPCQAEYDDPADRRFHAQPLACPDCGPTLQLSDENGLLATGDDSMVQARRLLTDGRILAVKGLGGYHLVCDATNEATVTELRRRKRRGDKPFAVMARDLATLRQLAEVEPAAEALLTGVRRPIVLLPRSPGTAVAASVAPGNPDLGLMLPYTPLHVLLLGLDDDPPGPDVLVMTSGNLAGEPIVTDDDEARVRLAGLVDAWLTHDRPIHVPCDDSVVRCVGGRELPIRRSRGYAPMPVLLPFEVEPTLAVGADLKNTCAVADGRYAWVSQHIGDMDDLSTIAALGAAEQHLESIGGVSPTLLAADLHPAYRSATWARAHANGRPVRTVQHHHAHVASVMGEHRVPLDTRVIGIAFDGTGYGTDGAIWGGEVLVADYAGFRRAAHLAYVPLAGGDASVERPYRMALAHLWAAGIPWDERLPSFAACPERERAVLAHQLETGFGCVPTSSMGRLFDAVASLAGVRHVADFEAEAAIALEGVARSAGAPTGTAYRLGLEAEAEAVVADPAPLLRAVVDDVLAGVPAATISLRFHAALSALVADLAELCRRDTGLGTVVLGGGVFQNARLLADSRARLEERCFDVLVPQQLPPNDGGVALGQVLVAAATEREEAPCA